VIGSGISGLSCAWLLSQRHQVHLYEAEGRLGGHSHTVEASVAAGAVPVDMGFIVYNEINYPNLTALFDHLGVATEASNMGFAVSLDEGRVEYGGDSLPALFAQWRNLASPRFWRMLVDLTRFYREAPGEAAALEADMTSLGDYLDRRGYGRAFQDDHLLPQAAAIWSTSTKAMRDYPAAAFIRFCDNHGLLKIVGRPTWRTVTGGSRSYVQRLAGALGDRVHLNAAATSLRRLGDGVRVLDAAGREARYDQVVIAAHADQALAMMADATARERRVLGAFGYSRNDAVLHTDDRLMPTRRKTWSAWNYVGETGAAGGAELCVTYWMNRLQNLPGETPLFVTLNPYRAPDPAKVLRRESFTHPLYDAAALRAQAELWSLQGQGGLWWCGAYFGAGFHEDGLQSGLAVAEALGGVRRPWTVANESGRIRLATGATASDRPAKAA
jgi:predicted NAD/FAD-binding protein